MNIVFDPRRSEAIRAGLVAEAGNASAQRHPWRGLALVLAGVLVGTGATTAAFANGSVMPLEPTPDASPAPALNAPVVVVGFDKTGASEWGEQEVTVIAETETENGGVRIEYHPTANQRKVGVVRFKVAEPSALDLSGHPDEASKAMVSISCPTKGQITLTDEQGSQAVFGGGEDSGGGSGGGPAMTLALMVNLDDKPLSQIKPVGGCVAEATVTYYAQD